MGFARHSLFSNKIPEYASQFPREWLVIRGINKICKDLYKNVPYSYFEERFSFFSHPLAKKVKQYLLKYSRAVERGRLKSDILFYQDANKYLKEIKYILESVNDIIYKDEIDDDDGDILGTRELTRIYGNDIKDFSEAYYKFLEKQKTIYSLVRVEIDSDGEIVSLLDNEDSD